MSRRKKKLPKLAEIKSSDSLRDARGRFIQPDEAPDILALGIRAKHLGLKNDKEGRKQANQAHLGDDDVGRCLERLAPDDAIELWKVWQRFCGAQQSYRRRLFSQTGFPAGSSVQFVAEKYETDQSMTQDLRTEEERDAAAKAAYHAWNGYCDEIPLQAKSLIYCHERGLGHIQLWASAGPTAQGMKMVSAIRELAKAAG